MTDADIPRKVSASPQSNYYDPYWSHRVEVLLDGVTVKHAVTADADEGWIDVEDVDEAGKPIPDGKGEVKVKRIFGKVTFTILRGAK